MLTINVLGHKELQVKNHTTLLEVSKILGIKPYAAKVNKRLRELNSRLLSDAEVEFLYLNNSDAVRIYEASLRFLSLWQQNLYPAANVVLTTMFHDQVLTIIRI